jgi:hypothetical protein
MKKLVVMFGALLFAGSISAHGYHGCGRGFSVGFYAPQPNVYYAPRPTVCEHVIVERPRYYDPYEYRDHGCHRRYHEEYRGGYREYR